MNTGNPMNMSEELVATVARHGSEIQEIRRSLNVFGTELHNQTAKTDNILSVLAEIKADAKNNSTLSMLDILKGAITIGLFMGMFVGGVAYIVTSMQGAELALMKERISVNTKTLADRTEAIKYYERIEADVNRRIKQSRLN